MAFASGNPIGEDSPARKILKQHGNDTFQLIDGFLYFTRNYGTLLRHTPNTLLFVPPTLRHQVLLDNHTDKLAGHLATNKTLRRISSKFWWPNLYTDVYTFVKQCAACNVSHGKLRINQGTPQPIVVSRVFEIVGIDLLTLPVTRSNNKYVIVAVDHLSRSVELGALPTKDANTVATWIMANLICRHGTPESFLSDQGTEFTNSTMAAICKGLHIKQRLTTTAHPQSNGLTERVNRNLIKILKAYMQQYDADWDFMLPYAQFAINTSFHPTLQETPFYVLHGRDPRLSLDNWLPLNFDSQPINIKTFVSQHIARLREAWDHAHSSLLQAASDNVASSKKKPTKFLVGDKVWCYLPEIVSDSTNKLLHRWFGPFVIIEQMGPVTYKVHTNRTRRISQTFHVERLKPYFPTDPRPTTDLTLDNLAPAEVRQLQVELVDLRSDNTPPPPPTEWPYVVGQHYQAEPHRPNSVYEQQLVGKYIFNPDGVWYIYGVAYHPTFQCVTTWMQFLQPDATGHYTPTQHTHAAPASMTMRRAYTY